MRDEEQAGYYCLMIAILCNLNADESRKMYKYGPDHPLCQKILRKKVQAIGLEKLNREQSGSIMKELLSQGYSVDAVSEAFQCFPSTVRRRVRNTKTKKETDDSDADAHRVYGTLEGADSENIWTWNRIFERIR